MEFGTTKKLIDLITMKGVAAGADLYEGVKNVVQSLYDPIHRD
jgi:hypothetical protein